MRRELLFGLQLRDFDAGYERRTGRAVWLEGDWGITSTSRILSQPEFRTKENVRIQYSITLRAKPPSEVSLYRDCMSRPVAS
jgi:hypothetical protein